MTTYLSTYTGFISTALDEKIRYEAIRVQYNKYLNPAEGRASDTSWFSTSYNLAATALTQFYHRYYKKVIYFKYIFS